MRSSNDRMSGEDLHPGTRGEVHTRAGGQVQGDPRPCRPEGPNHAVCLAQEDSRGRHQLLMECCVLCYFVLLVNIKWKHLSCPMFHELIDW